MTIEQAMSCISSLSVEEQLRIVQTVWEQLPANSGTILSDDQRAELDRRMDEYRMNPETALSEAELQQKIRAARS